MPRSSRFARRFSFIVKLVLPPDASFTPWKAVIVLLIALTIGGLVEKFGLKRVFPPALIFLTVLFVASVLSAQWLNVSLVFIPIFLTVVLKLAAVQLKTLWLIDSALTEKIVHRRIYESKAVCACSKRFCRFPKRLFLAERARAN